ncbi:hypothetical protein CR513_61797, partial [Mucuna pruriens]
MTDSTIKILNLIFFFVFISQGYSECSFNNLVISQSTTGNKVHRTYQEWLVAITSTGKGFSTLKINFDAKCE